MVCGDNYVVPQSDCGENIVADDSPEGDSPEGNGTDGNGTDGNATGLDFKIKADNLVWYYEGNPIFNFMVVDSNGTGVANETVSITLKNKIYNVTTDEMVLAVCQLI